jgi:hypothetical protein
LDLAGQRKRLLTFSLDGAPGFFCVLFLFLQKRERYVSAFTCKEHCDGTTDTGIATRDQRDFLFQFSRALV